MADAHHETRRETSDVNIRAILGFGGGLIVAAVVIHFLVWLLFAYFQRREAPSATREFPLALEQQSRLPPEPRLQTSPREDLKSLQERDEAILSTYGWVDRNAGIVRIPIDEAMKLTVERGLPSRQGNSR
jgi:hypothetical protein